MKLSFDVTDKHQADPFIFDDGEKLYLYVTGNRGVEAYSANTLLDTWHFEGIVARFEGCHDYWAPSVIQYNGRYYMYVSCMGPDIYQFMHVACADSPLGPFTNEKCLYKRFSIDSHAVETEAGLFLWYAEDRTEGDRIGTRVFVDKLLDPYTPANAPKEVIVPTFDEEIYTPQYSEERRWHTIEGPFWFKEGDWQYVMYSGGCYQDDTYHIGYAAARTNEADLTKVDYVKHTNNGAFSPVLIKNEFEEGTGHHSVIKYRGSYYAIYHGRDYADNATGEGYNEARTARVCRLTVEDGVITAQRYADRV